MDANSRRTARIEGGTFNGVVTVGQGNEVRVGAVNTGEGDLDQLRRLVGELVEHLDQCDREAPDQVLARERAEQLAEELAEPDPRSGRVRRAWERLSPVLETTKSGFDAVAQIGGLVSQLTT